MLILITKCEQWSLRIGGAPCAVKAACTVRTGGKGGDAIKTLPIGIVYGIAITAMSFFTDERSSQRDNCVAANWSSMAESS